MTHNLMIHARHWLLVCLPAFALLPSAAAHAQSALDLHHAASATVHVSISNIKGAVTVTGWDKPEVSVSGYLGEGAKPLTIEGSNDALSIKVQAQGRSGFLNWGSDNAMGSTTLNLQVPRGAALDIDVVSANARVSALAGGAIKINSVSGKIYVQAQTPSLDVDSVSGGIEQTGSAARADLQTVSGDIVAPSLGHTAKIDTVSGQLRIAGGPWRELSLNSVSGDIDAAGALQSQGKIDVDSMSGDVSLALPADSSATLHASSFSGDLQSDVGTAQKNERGPGSELSARSGTGSGKVSIETFSGDVRIRTSH